MQNAVEGRRKRERGEKTEKGIIVVGVRGEAREGQAALSSVHSSYFPPLIHLVLVPPLYYFSAPSPFAAVWRDRLIILACRGEMQMARCSTPLSSLTSLLIFPLSSPPSLMNQEN